jgi:hypothetical protein
MVGHHQAWWCCVSPALQRRVCLAWCAQACCPLCKTLAIAPATDKYRANHVVIGGRHGSVASGKLLTLHVRNEAEFLLYHGYMYRMHVHMHVAHTRVHKCSNNHSMDTSGECGMTHHPD